MKAEKKSEELGYGEAMVRLDQILEDIDQSRLSLDVMAERVLEAATLLKHCKGLLTETEAKVKDVLEELDREFGEEPAPF